MTTTTYDPYNLATDLCPACERTYKVQRGHTCVMYDISSENTAYRIYARDFPDAWWGERSVEADGIRMMVDRRYHWSARGQRVSAPESRIVGVYEDIRTDERTVAILVCPALYLLVWELWMPDPDVPPITRTYTRTKIDERYGYGSEAAKAAHANNMSAHPPHELRERRIWRKLGDVLGSLGVNASAPTAPWLQPVRVDQVTEQAMSMMLDPWVIDGLTGKIGTGRVPVSKEGA